MAWDIQVGLHDNNNFTVGKLSKGSLPTTKLTCATIVNINNATKEPHSKTCTSIGNDSNNELQNPPS